MNISSSAILYINFVVICFKNEQDITDLIQFLKKFGFHLVIVTKR